MAVNDFSNQNIQDTYQRVVQTDGTKVYDGTGSTLPIEFNENHVIISGTLTAQSYIVSESVTSVSSGSTIFGNTIDDIHQLTGSLYVTSSNLTITPISLAIGEKNDGNSEGDITASGYNLWTLANTLPVNFSRMVENTVTLGANHGSFPTTVSGSTLRLHASADIICDMDGSDFRLNKSDTEYFRFNLDSNPEIDVTGDLIIDPSGNDVHLSDADLVVTGSITASGHISASGGISASHMTVHGDITSSGNLLIAESIIRFSDDDTKIGMSDNLLVFQAGGTNFVNMAGSSNELTLAVDVVKVSTHISASGNISASGYISTEGSITASGEISASGDVHTFGGRIHTPRIDNLDEQSQVFFGTGVNVNSKVYLNTQGHITASIISTSSDIITANIKDPTDNTSIALSNTTITATGILDIPTSTEATDASGDTGALRVEGGASIAKNIYAGGVISGSQISSSGNITATGNITASGTISASKFEGTERLYHYSNVGFSGDTVSFGSGPGGVDGDIVAGEMYYLNGSQQWTVTDADAGASAGGMLGIAVADDEPTFLIKGFIQNTVFGGFTTGDVLYVSTSSGDVQNSAPDGNNDIARVVGYVVNGGSRIIFFDPDKTFVEVSA